MSATSTSPSSSSTSGGRNSGPSLIGPNTTQSQILLFVFLAVGLFSAVAIATLGWRRAYHVRTQWDARRVGRTEGVKSCRGDLRPRLWDLWTKLTEGVEAGVKVAESEALVSNEENVGPRIKTGRWEDFMPISITSLRPEHDETQSIESVEPDPPLSVSSHVRAQIRLRWNRTAAYYGFGRYHVAQRPGTRTQQEAELREGDGRTVGEAMRMLRHEELDELFKGEELDDLRRNYSDEILRKLEFQVAVAITMPGPRNGDGIRPEQKMRDYSIGVCQLRWVDN